MQFSRDLVADRDTIRNRLLAIITVLLVTAALRASYPVSMPLAFAALLIAAVWPAKIWLNRILPSSMAYLGTILLLLALFAFFCAALYISAAQAVDAFVQNQGRFEQMYDAFSNRLERLGLPDPGGREGYARLIAVGQLLLSRAYTVIVYLGFIAILVILGLPEVSDFRRKAWGEMDGSGRREFADTTSQIAGKIRSYIAVTTLTSLLTGCASALWALATGLDLALVWGVLNFLLNYVPVVGNIVGIVPPALYALIQFEGWTMPAVIFLGFSAIQIAISNFVYPMMQGKGLSLSPLAILVALAFWGWVWGIAGALIAVPLTATTVIVCQHFRSTEWIARMLSAKVPR